MNYTQNFHFPQWEKSDRVLMDDFNQMCRDMEDGLLKTAQDAASGTSSAVSSAASAAAKAQSSANAALSAAKAAQASADAAQETADQAFSPSFLPFKAGIYSGAGSTVNVYLGFKPSFVIITRQSISTSSESIRDVAVVGPDGNMSSLISFSNTGFSVHSVDYSIYTILNFQNRTYS